MTASDVIVIELYVIMVLAALILRIIMGMT